MNNHLLNLAEAAGLHRNSQTKLFEFTDAGLTEFYRLVQLDIESKLNDERLLNRHLHSS